MYSAIGPLERFAASSYGRLRVADPRLDGDDGSGAYGVDVGAQLDLRQGDGAWASERFLDLAAEGVLWVAAVLAHAGRLEHLFDFTRGQLVRTSSASRLTLRRQQVARQRITAHR
ncbi:hypothetical protein C5C45_13175 [Rathayibacter rathayi]|uniref:Uncharacterized protein n=1 Tax=Rathayibacter rathayi TaxID=33887 RepID=A0ABD6W6W3_RATRA|nr:hypothetical protein C5C04_11445 [Rathayibacter rathayi]PPF45183.1 hypothetical protein C5C08_12575 [Rathayibacter rathayi]PPF77708.1 hypothetical protein C5C14_12065 [Rathayibacter rathayi]PPG11561.1 hypothetical protein C5C11_12140 [Rathayibacter rathayi]PPG37819.1 hypothetical protein C5C20_13400 [Rathayibacter rathayi]